MDLSHGHTSTVVTDLTGLAFGERTGVEGAEPWIEIFPEGHDRAKAFVVRTTIGWRHLDIRFLPGSFSKQLLTAMRRADSEARSLFCQLVRACERFGAVVSLRIDGQQYRADDEEFWLGKWNNVSFRFRVGQLDFSESDTSSYNTIVALWAGRVAAAVLALMPTVSLDHGLSGYEEGAVRHIKATRYERDPRNRAAALAIHGFSCGACGLLLAQTYGEIAEGFIEIHHKVPVSELGEDYVVDPTEDLIPLCPNCHTIAHRRDPPLSLDELQSLLER